MGAIKSLSFNNVKGTYYWALEKRTNASWLGRVATTVPSDQPFEVYKWLEGAPAMTKFTGERDSKSLKDFGFTVLNDKFTNTLDFDIDDVRRDKGGQVLRRVAEMAGKAATLPERLMTTLLQANPTSFDEASFFADTHNHGGVCDNDLPLSAAAPDTPTTAEMSTAILSMITAMYGFTDDQGDPANEEAQSFTLVVPVKYLAAAKGAMLNDFTSAGVSNTLPVSGFNVSLAINPRLLGTAATAGRRMYLFRDDAPVRACLWQEEAISDAFKTLGPDSSEAFWKERIAFGGKRIGQAALGQFLLAARGTFA